MQRVFMIGWDGATFDLIRPWVQAGKLPTIARLMADGVHGPLRSTLPPWTFPAWTSFQTGKNPGKHGIYDFFRPRPNSYNLEFVNGSHRKAATFWKVLSAAGRTVVSISLPCTFPPEPVNGVMISGFDFPGEGPGSDVDRRGMYPPELYDELNGTIGRHPIDAPIIKEINAGQLDVALQRMLETVRKKAATAKYLLRKQTWDCFMILFGESDGSGHQFWKYCDPQSPLFTDRPEVRDAILRVYQELDTQVAELLKQAPADAAVMMMSDHGFGGVGDWALYPNRWLEQHGLVRFDVAEQSRMGRLLGRLKLWAVASLPAGIQRLLYRSFAGLVGRLEARVRYSRVNWSGTRAFFDENPYFPQLRINLKGRQPQGTVEPGAEYDELCTQIVQKLEAWRHPETGQPIVERAYRREEVYSGPYVGDAPDVVVKWALNRGYSYAFKASAKVPAGTWIEQLDLTKADNQQFFNGKSGTHRDDGIFLACGPGIRAGETVQKARIIDLAPTILNLLDVPVPADMDGRVLEEIFSEKHVPVAAPCAAVACESVNGNGHGNGTYSADDEALISERLKALGYME
jgi:predicted AlkP superfamily phosphohydrolase/phosphomutase